MAWLWLCFLVALVSLVGLSCANDAKRPNMTNPPLLNFGKSQAGDDEVTSFDTSVKVPLRMDIVYFGSTYRTLYISKDGLISFDENAKYLESVTWAEGIRIAKYDWPFMTPFYHEGYNPTVIMNVIEYQGSVSYRVIDRQELDKEAAKADKHYSDNMDTMAYYNQYVQEAVINSPKNFSAELIIVITWNNVTDKTSARDSSCDQTKENPCKSATFQAVIIADKTNTFAMFNYLSMDIPYQSSYQAGFNGGFGRGWFNVIPCYGECAVALNKSRVNDLPKLKGTDLQGRYFLNVGGEEIVRGGCLPDSLRAGRLEIFPQNVGMFGGEKLEVSGKCLQPGSKIFCKFGAAEGSPISSGAMYNDMKGYCPVPLMTVRGPVLVSWSKDGKYWSTEKYITVVLPDSVPEPTQGAKEKAEWYSRDASKITVQWDSSILSSHENATVEVKLIGYRELKDEVQFKELKLFGETANSEGSYSFSTSDHSCTDGCKDFEMGLLEVGLSDKYYDAATDRVAHRFGPIPLGWYVDKQLSKDKGNDWSDQMCRAWNAADRAQMDWLKQLPECPCTLDQALADFGSWQAQAGCDLFRGSECTYHQGAKHCVRSVQPTPDGAGNQCCYDHEGSLMWSQLSYKGSTPDRGHASGSHPYNIPDRVPSLSHWKHDVVPFYYCCLWNGYDLCDLYVKQRPTTDCSLYQVPGLGLVRGDSHVTTFDGQTFHFGGYGDFFLLATEEVTIQGRFLPRRHAWDLGKKRKQDKTSWNPTALESLAIQGSGPILEVNLAPENSIYPRGLDIRIGNERHFFNDISTKWQDLQGLSIVNNAQTMTDNPHNNFTILTEGVGVIVYAVNDLLHVTVALPHSMKQSGNDLVGTGLLGVFDGKRGNDYVSENSTIYSLDTDPEALFNNYGMSWAVSQRHCMFPFSKDPSKYDLNSPFFKYEDIPHGFEGSPSDVEINSTCGANENCQWDYRMTGSKPVAEATSAEDEAFNYTHSSASRVDSCGFLDVGGMANLSSLNFTLGNDVEVNSCDGDYIFGGSVTFKCIKEHLTIAEGANRQHYGRRVKEDRGEYIIHWVPEPFHVCSANSCEDPEVGDGAKLSSYVFSVGKEIEVEGCDDGSSFGGKAKFSCIKETLAEAKAASRDYGQRIKDNQKDFIIHWVPKPHQVCTSESEASASESGNTSTIIGIVVAVVVVIIIIIAIVVIKKRKASKRSNRKDHTDIEETGEPMISRNSGGQSQQAHRE